ncbi:GNAT family N-acetyltransferase [Aspergillus foveolatus]|uniref:GNAT family N-acetyltransferase n=1 Tax=Aspergillus foveolatus TaxID=210207 RepID=UPI003CCCE1CC
MASTPSPLYTSRQVERSDLGALEELLFTSKLSLTINRLLFNDWPNEAAQRRDYRAALEHQDLESDDRESLSVIDNASGKLIGCIALCRRQPELQMQAASPSVEGPEKQMNIPEKFQPRGLQGCDGSKVVYIAVDRAFRRRGIGRDLIWHAFAKAKAAGVPVAVSSEPQAYAFFTKIGFEETKSVEMDLAQWALPYSGFGTFRLRSMIWDP